MKKHCEYCGKEYETDNITKHRKNVCSHACADMYNKWNKTPNVSCCICGTEFYVKPSRLKRLKYPNKICCSEKCEAVNRSHFMKGKNNHQYGLKGPLNASFVKEKTIDCFGYVYVYAPNHPFANKDGRIREHRLIAEQYLLTESCMVVMNGKCYLDPKYDVHHIDENKMNNDPANLIILSRSRHISLHNELRDQKRDKITGKWSR